MTRNDTTEDESVNNLRTLVPGDRVRVWFTDEHGYSGSETATVKSTDAWQPGGDLYLVLLDNGAQIEQSRSGLTYLPRSPDEHPTSCDVDLIEEADGDERLPDAI